MSASPTYPRRSGRARRTPAPPIACITVAFASGYLLQARTGIGPAWIAGAAALALVASVFAVTTPARARGTALAATTSARARGTALAVTTSALDVTTSALPVITSALAVVPATRARRFADAALLVAVALAGLAWGQSRPRPIGPPVGLSQLVVRGVVRQGGAGMVLDRAAYAWMGSWHQIRAAYLIRSFDPVPEGGLLARGFLVPLGELAMPGLSDPDRCDRWEGLSGRFDVKERWPEESVRPTRRALVRATLARRIGRSLPESIRTLIPMLVWGESGRLDPVLVRIFRSTGTMHLIAISGLHVSLIALLLEFLLRILIRRASIRACAVLGGLAAYTWIVGPLPSVVRSAIMAGSLLVARAAGRPGAMGNAWWAALLIVIAFTPGEVPSTGMQLSFAATAALILRPRLSRRLDLLFASFAATCATSGILWAHFGETAPFSIVANLIGIPAFTPVLISILWGLAWGNPPGATFQSIAWGPARLFADSWIRPLALMTPAGEATIVRISCGEATGILASLIFLAILGLARSRRSRAAAAAISIPAATSILLAICLAPSIARARSPRVCEAIILPVGQGDATLVRSGRRAWLVDSGPGGPDGSRGRRRLAPALRWLGIHRLNGVFLTHGDEDHVGGLRGLMIAGIRIDTLYVSGGTDTRLALPRSRVPPVRVLSAGWSLRDGPVTISALWPPRNAGTRGNEGSLVLRVEARGEAWTGSCVEPRMEARGRLEVRVPAGGSLVLPGDLGKKAEDALAARVGRATADVLLAGHHGSAGSTGDAWLDRLRPRVVLISCGARNRFGHPSPPTLARLRARGIEVHRTDREGTLVLRWVGPGALGIAASRTRR